MKDFSHISIPTVSAEKQKKSFLLSSFPVGYTSRGFVYVREADDLVEGAKEAVRQVLSDYPSIESGEWNAVKSGIRDAVQRYVYTTLKRSPMILPIIMDI